MCYRTTCPKCQKATWGGCGRHIESALAGVPQAERCRCNEAPVPKTNEPPRPPRSRWWPFGN
ncbi:MAG: hypothetical protein DI536_32040 [Archangium gephyra]|uniref:Uncharacterized protein n=1 Tax=Archangium gephyra TaxID=48 RepID=A0A2W5SS68_9BACT|nr:MAG: hypothetical protein DI536_32040 [Archangium gephyra]